MASVCPETEKSVSIVSLKKLRKLIGDLPMLERLEAAVKYIDCSDNSWRFPKGSTGAISRDLANRPFNTIRIDMDNLLILRRYFYGNEAEKQMAAKLLEARSQRARLLTLVIEKGVKSWEELELGQNDKPAIPAGWSRAVYRSKSVSKNNDDPFVDTNKIASNLGELVASIDSRITTLDGERTSLRERMVAISREIEELASKRKMLDDCASMLRGKEPS